MWVGAVIVEMQMDVHRNVNFCTSLTGISHERNQLLIELVITDVAQMGGNAAPFFVQPVDVERHTMSQQGVQGVVITEQLTQHRVFHLTFDIAYGELGTWVDAIGDGGLLAFHLLVKLDIGMHVSFVVEYLTQILNGTLCLYRVIDDWILTDLTEQTRGPVRSINTTEAVNLERYLCTKPLAVGCLQDIVIKHQTLSGFAIA